MAVQLFVPIPCCQGQRCWVGGLLLEQLLVKKGDVLAQSQAGPGRAGCFGEAIQQEPPGPRGFLPVALRIGGEGCPFEHHSSDWIVPPALAVQQFRRFIPGHH